MKRDEACECKRLRKRPDTSDANGKYVYSWSRRGQVFTGGGGDYLSAY